ncbi:MAG: rhodanese-like domain-containing protein, partial [Cyanobacteria bacterium]|nr:rhodanese-like domain-containing protein [Cyanobacteriota bacterium]MDW8202615.1 rhodanese-like domain-containing protein [Cyanobacteriota bacterium SKYGB_h_bin112]
AGSRVGVEALLARLRSDSRLATLEANLSFVNWMPFQRLKVRLRSEIITLGQPIANPHHYAGTYIDPSDWNRLISDPSVTVLDVRNRYEVDCGTFNRAINPEIDSFAEFPNFVHHNLDPQVHRKIAMFCTGGIRCEKASAYMLSQGFEQVYQLKGGILKYLETIPAHESQWHGDCFVFDDRVTLNHNLQPSHHP